MTDRQMLDMLKLRDQGMSFTQIAAEMGLTRGQVSGTLFRIDTDLAKSEQ